MGFWRVLRLVKYLSPNGTDLIDPAESYVFHEFKCSSRENWYLYKYKCVTAGDLQSTN